MLKIVLKHTPDEGLSIESIELDTGSRDVCIHRSGDTTLSLSGAAADLVTDELCGHGYGKRKRTPLRVALEQAELELEAANNAKNSLIRGLFGLYLQDKISHEMVLKLIETSRSTAQKTSE